MRLHPNRLSPKEDRERLAGLYRRVQEIKVYGAGEGEDETLDRDLYLELTPNARNEFDISAGSPRHLVHRVSGMQGHASRYSIDTDEALSLVPSDRRWLGFTHEDGRFLAGLAKVGEPFLLSGISFSQGMSLAQATLLALLLDKMRREVAVARMTWWERLLDSTGFLSRKRQLETAG